MVLRTKGRKPIPMQIRNAVLLWLFCTISLCSSAQKKTLGFKTLTSEDGLSQGTITAIIEDSKGIMWVGTQNGLNRMIGNDIQRLPRTGSDNLSLP